MTFTQVLFSFTGRVRRRHWWFAVAMLILIPGLGDAVTPDSPSPLVVIWALTVQAALLWIIVAVSAKRWHDVGKSGWWTLIHLLPVVGIIVALGFNGLSAGNPDANRYGEPLP
ncbi:DUF805 domain-containing protein [Montanilutibacter psychrotolerans]|uniref:DUF805 domain-containing protein n=1 Tax=Montanilutibacter psychrotolerans TaxID=1327343 RepID=A0A3M8SL33_9GAMM|nr:DUF805 domain-containing protein [Lysobacter psychrotolerans]RNF82077.1 DUF805 domain-containing protein [Lysobacter psychrotolerans]